MNKKELVILAFVFVFVLFLASFALAQDNETTAGADKAYDCLKNQTSGKNLSLNAATFSLLAIGGQDLFNQVELYKDTTNACWPKNSCRLKETSQVLLAYNRVGKDTSAIKSWILSKNSTTSELRWLLEIDINEKTSATCTINDGQRSNTITIAENAQIQGSPGRCLSIDSSGYMLVVSQSCLRNTFSISCDKNFLTSVLYQRATSETGTLFVLPDSHGQSASGTTTETINGECFKTGGACDYEGTLWAVYALKKLDVDVSNYIPFLLALADDNVPSFPSAFLYPLTGGDDQYNLVIEQKPNQYWQIAGTKEGKYYDTSLGMLSLANREEDIAATKTWLLNTAGKDGCWGGDNIRDTAFLLYSGWPETPAAVAGAISSSPCSSPNSCVGLFECNSSNKVELICANSALVCCNTPAAQLQTCDLQGGLVCSSTQECSGGRTAPASDGQCCIGGSCANVQVSENTCTPAGGTCKATCASNEDVSVETCSSVDQFCCTAKGGGISWIVILIILIVLVALGIIFRKSLEIWWFKLKGKFKKQPPVQLPRTAPAQQMVQRQMIQQRTAVQPVQMRPIRTLPKDKEMEEALRKLREMSKK